MPCSILPSLPSLPSLDDIDDDDLCLASVSTNATSQSKASSGRSPPAFGLPVRVSAVSEAHAQESDLQMPDHQQPQRIPEAAHVFIDPEAQYRASMGPPPPTLSIPFGGPTNPCSAHLSINPLSSHRGSTGPPPPTLSIPPSFTQGSVVPAAHHEESAAPEAPIQENKASENNAKRGIATRILSFLRLSWLRRGRRQAA